MKAFGIFNDFFVKKLCVLLCVCFLTVFASSCEYREAPRAEAILSEMLSAAEKHEEKGGARLSAGRIYTLDGATEADNFEVLSHELLTALYGNGSENSVLGELSDGAVWCASGMGAEEMAVFRCGSRRERSEMADLCLGRIEMMKHFWRSNGEKLSLDGEGLDRLESATVSVIGRYVVMVAVDEPESVLEAARRIIK